VVQDLAVAGGDLSRLRQINLLATIRALRTAEALTLTEIAKKTRLSRPAVEAVVDDLVQQGWIAELAPTSGSVGRPARRFRFRAETGRVLGMDIGAHKMVAMVANLDGEVLATSRAAVPPDASRVGRLGLIDTIIGACLAEAAIGPNELWMVAAGSTGVVDADGRVVLSMAIPAWTGFDLAGYIGQLVPCPVLVENDCNLAALGERWLGVAREVDDAIYVLAGMRTAAGLIIDGKLHRGFGGGAGEVGILHVLGWDSAPDHLFACQGLPADIAPNEVAGWVFASAREGNAAALVAVERYARALATGIAAMVLTVDPELVVLGGGISRSADVLLKPLRRELTELCFRLPRIETSTLGDEGVVRGALRYALDHVDQRVFGLNDSPTAPVPLRRDDSVLPPPVAGTG
jgi:predicted NBD/HSP70 family sugar kinase